MSLVTQPAPEFKVMAVMPDGTFQEVKMSDYKGKYVCLFFYPLDFTFVCPSEIIAFDKMVKEFEARKCQLLGCSIDSHFTHFAWRNTALKDGGIGPVKYPLVSDLTHQIAKDYGVHIDMGVALRGLFIIDKNQVVRHQVVNDLPLGRSIDEALRILDALQFHEQHGEVCPANWKKGAKGMKADAKGVASYLASEMS